MKGILFNGGMVRAILEDRKKQTRRVIKDGWLQGMTKTGELYEGLNSPPYKLSSNFRTLRGRKLVYPKWGYRVQTHVDADRVEPLFCRYEVADILYVRETWAWYPTWDCEAECFNCVAYKDEMGCFRYRTDYGTTKDDSFPPDCFKWRPSIHMPREAARICLKVTGVRVERLQEISRWDIDAEGCPYRCESDEGKPQKQLAWFVGLWDSINEKRGYGWEQNPWVWVYEFERVSHDQP